MGKKREGNLMKVPYLDLKSQYLSIKEEINKEVLDTLKSSSYSLGPKVEAFEKNFSAYSNSKYTVGVNSGTSALHIALQSLDIGSGDEVIVPAMTFVATPMAVSYTGAKPVFVDTFYPSGLINFNKIEEKITSRTKAIIPVHLYGQCADLIEIKKIAKKHKLKIIEDASQAHGSHQNDINIGQVSDAATYSFYPGKNLGAYGESGCATTNNQKLYKKMTSLRNWGQKRKHFHDDISYNYRMDGIQGAILNVKLKKIDQWIKKRRKAAKIYNEILNKELLKTTEEIGNYHVYHIYGIFLKNRDKLQNYLLKKNIFTGNHYPVPCHLQKPYAKFGYKKNDFPDSELIAKNQVSLPIYPEITEKMIEYVSLEINKWTAKNS